MSTDPASDMPDHLTLRICKNCDDGDESTEHKIRVVEDWAMIQALLMIHGDPGGHREWIMRGGVYHVTMETARAWMERGGQSPQ